VIERTDEQEERGDDQEGRKKRKNKLRVEEDGAREERSVGDPRGNREVVEERARGAQKGKNKQKRQKRGFCETGS
jgi:hypothetical protein